MIKEALTTRSPASKKIIFLSAILWMFATAKVSAQLQDMKLLNAPIDISNDFNNTYYLADSLSSFDPATATGKITYKRYNYATRQAFNNMLGVLRPVAANEFPATEYQASPQLPFSIQFVSARTVRLRATSGFQV